MKKILVIDDDRDILEVVKLILTNHQFEVETIFNWKLISSTIQTYSPHLILLDVSLGGADGRVICKQLKDANETQDIPLILFSANHNLVNNLGDCEPDAIMTKPFDGSNLVSTIQKHLS